MYMLLRATTYACVYGYIYISAYRDSHIIISPYLDISIYICCLLVGQIYNQSGVVAGRTNVHILSVCVLVGPLMSSLFIGRTNVPTYGVVHW